MKKTVICMAAITASLFVSASAYAAGYGYTTKDDSSNTDYVTSANADGKGTVLIWKGLCR